MDTQGFIGDNAGMGQGLAYVLPNSRTESYAIQLNQERAAQQRAQAALVAKQMQAQDALYAKHLYDNKIPEHNAQWDAAINPLFQKYTSDAADYHARTGKDAFSQPEFVQRRNDILSMAGNSKQAAQKAVALSTLINNDRDNKLDPADKTKIAQALVDYNADPVKNYAALNGLTANPRMHDQSDAFKLAKPAFTTVGTGSLTTTAPDRPRALQQAEEIYSSPQFDRFKERVGINPQVGDIGAVETKQGHVRPETEAETRIIAKHIMDGAELPGSVATFEATGINPKDPNAEQKLTEFIMKQNAGYNKLYNQYADYNATLKDPSSKVDFSADNNAMQHIRLGLAKQANARAASKSNGSMQTPAQTLITGDPSNGIAGMQQGGPGTGEKFIALAPKAQYGGKKPVIKMDTETGEHVFEFPDILGGKDAANIKFNAELRKAYDKKPEKVGGGIFGIGSTKVPFEKSEQYKLLKPEVVIKRPAQQYKLNPSSPDYAAQAAEMAKEQNINLSQLNQIEGKKGNKGQIQQVIGGKAPAQAKSDNQVYKVKGKDYKASAVSKAAAASGMTVEEYLHEVNK